MNVLEIVLLSLSLFLLTPVQEKISEFYIQKFYIHKMRNIPNTYEIRE